MAGFLVEADHVSCGIAKPRGHLGRICADRLHEFASVGNGGFYGRGHAVHHDVDEQAPGSEDAGRPTTHVPLTSPVVSSNAV